jgi:hypothetical protein
MRRAVWTVALLGALFGAAPALAQQFARPDGTVAPGGTWTSVGAPTLHEAVDESTANDDVDYMNATVNTTDELTLQSLTDPGVGTGHVIRYRMQSFGGGAKERVEIQLYQGTTLIASTGTNHSRGGYSTFSYTLLNPEADAITDYGDLRFRVVSSSVEAGESVRMTWAELEVPSAAAAIPPTLSTPTVASVDTASAVLGATIVTDGGAPILRRGTVWNTTGAPIVENELDEGGTALGAYSHARGSLPIATQIFYRGYAVNSSGTGYSPDDSFYTEPDQASGVTFSSVSATSMRISWTAAPSTTNAIVVMKQGSPVDSGPVDGTAHAPNSTFALGEELGTGNYVVFRAAGTQVDVVGLTASTTYFVAVYAYAGAGAQINYQQDVPATGSQATTAPPPVPTLSAPTAISIDTTTAVLGATINSDGGSPILRRGTVWNTTGAPIVESELDEGGTALGAFTDGRSALPVATQVFFRGYAENANGMGYSPDGTFYTEPNQASGVSFSNVTGGGMRVSWTSGGGAGSIVVMKEASAVDSDPVDGTAHAASATFGAGAELGTGNYVVFRAAGTQVDVTGLSPSTTYFVAVYEYAGAGGLINYQQGSPAVGSQATAAGGPVPVLSSPTVTGVGSTSATLGATIDSDSGSAIVRRGTVWNLTGAPVVENEIDEGGTALGAFSHLRSVLPGATLIYYRGYAENAGGIGYSPEDSFYTEPTLQPSGILIRDPDNLDGVPELRIRWRVGTGDGTIVVMRAGTPVDADPVDGTTYVANTVFGTGDEIGTGNYVVYVGTGTEVIVTGILSDYPYQLAFYEYSGSGASINYRQANSPRRSSGHNASHAIDCSECHFGTGALHGSFLVPRGTVQETTCQGCHNPTGLASAKSDVALHTGPSYGVEIDCGSCHDVHNGFDFTTTDVHGGGGTAANVEWIRPNTTKYVSAALEPALFQANTGFFAWDDANPPWNGMCQTCHTSTDRHRNDNTVPHSHEAAAACTSCHTHAGNGTGGFTPTGGSCTGCHDQQQEISANPGNFRRQITESSAGLGDGEFGTDFRSHHVNDGSGSQIVTEWDCVVCHAEGDVLTGSTDSNYHQKDGVQLKDVDTGAVYADWSTLTAAERSDFCLSCHDADGATSVVGRVDPDPDATTDALNPFNDQVTNAHEPDGFDGTAAPHSRGRCSATATIPCAVDSDCPAAETCSLLVVVDVASQFDTNNATHHAVLGPAYGPVAGVPVPGAPLDGAIIGGWAWDSTLACEDCHYGPVGTGLSGHGTANARYMLRDASGNDTLASGANIVCFACHNPSDAVSVYPEHDKSSHIDDALNLYGVSCLNCHGGGEWGGIHGQNEPVVEDEGRGTYNPNVFTYGAALDLISNWVGTAGTNVNCSAKDKGVPYLLTNCTQHGQTNYDRGYDRTYRAP